MFEDYIQSSCDKSPMLGRYRKHKNKHIKNILMQMNDGTNWEKKNQ